ncbi:hypothetical protein, partial [Pseudomonas sp. QD4]|uniref:hypothetical protein n=1 Tax=Pseudomonas sp. QD4 TaxID=3368618 RepID=UPI003B9DEE2F
FRKSSPYHGSDNALDYSKLTGKLFCWLAVVCGCLLSANSSRSWAAAFDPMQPFFFIAFVSVGSRQARRIGLALN